MVLGVKNISYSDPDSEVNGIRVNAMSNIDGKRMRASDDGEKESEVSFK